MLVDDEQITEVVEPLETDRGQQKTTDAAPDRLPHEPLIGRFEAWRTVQAAARARRRVERREARRFTARVRRLRLAWLIGTAVVVVVIGGAVATAFSPLMALRHIEVVGTHRIKSADVVAALKHELGTPLPLVRDSDVQHDLDDFRLIESYSTQLQPPSTIVVRITERTPIGSVKAGTGYQLVDQAGVVISQSAKQPSGYPLISLAKGQSPQTSPIFAAIGDVLTALPDSVSDKVTTASASSANAVTLTLHGGKTVVWGGADDAELKAEVLSALLKGAPNASRYDVSSPTSPVTK